jgi:hypothetical protein
VVFWVADAGQCGAYRLSRARRDAILAADAPSDLAIQIEHAEQAETGQPRAR